MIKIIEAYLAKLFDTNGFENRADSKANKFTPLELKTGEVRVFVVPDLGNEKDLVLDRWNVKVGDRVKPQDVICEIGNRNIVMEYESASEGKIIWICEKKIALTVGDVFGKIEGI
ncbi:biotin/lipoyl-containing protein [Maribacter sp. 1_MG-2023]|uniref:biotin/lipoyl-containing protein n=1 Tax=Maribacter sp. 1_MG-2023 TaxID=3062677 RepID=UPI0026E367A3|nr:biotin/lipoyl-containing protein [Maribacter sp. 1_MG-2023]MDO6473722.1 biotin/lipoyl-containing protein [Maribacter sp. 1_MG-2023]